MAIDKGNWMETDPVDMRGREIRVGDKVARAYTSGRAVNLQVVEVTQVKNGNVYLDGSKSPIIYPGRLLIVTEMYP